jgi:hypothetical protein
VGLSFPEGENGTVVIVSMKSIALMGKGADFAEDENCKIACI